MKKLIISSLFIIFRFRMAAENKIGRGPWSEWSYSINTDEEAPEGKPQMVEIKQKKENSLVVRIFPIRQDLFNR